MNSVADASPAREVAPRTNRVARVAGMLLIALALWLVHFMGPFPESPPELDPSWQQALVHAIRHGVGFGSELVFTYGPLGAPSLARYDPELFWPFFWLYHVLFMGLVAVRTAQAWTRRNQPIAIVAGLIGLLGFAVGQDSYAIAVLLSLGLAQLDREKTSRVGMALDVFVLAGFALTKFSYVTAIVVLLACFTVHVARQPDSSWKRAAWVPGWFVVSLVAVWLATGQRLLDLPLYFLRSAELASGYTESQANEGNPLDESRGFVLVSVLAVGALVHVLAHRRRRGSVLAAVAFAGCTFLAFRASYTFHVEVSPTFFAYAIVASVALFPAEGVRAAWLGLSWIVRTIAFVLAVHGFTSGFTSGVVVNGFMNGLSQGEESARTLVSLDERLAEIRERAVKLRRVFALPNVRAYVGREPIDFLGTGQAYVFLNDLNWRTRPVFQSYATTTQGLQELNGAFLRSERAPRFVLVDFGSIMGRVPFQDDACAWYEILARYRPVLLERGTMLFERDTLRVSNPLPRYVEVARREVAPGETFDLSAYEGDALRVRFDVRYSLRGRLRRALLRAPTTTIRVEYDDGRSVDMRLVPGMARVGVLVRPNLEFPEDWMNLFTSPATKSYTRFSVGSTSPWERFYEPTYTVIVERCEGLLPVPRADDRIALVFGTFPTRPTRVYATVPPRQFFDNGKDIALLAAGTHLAFPIEAGRRRITGTIGLLAGSENGDGVDFVFSLLSPSGERRVVKRITLDKTVSDYLRTTLDVEVEAAAGERLVIGVVNPPGRDTVWDMPYLSEIEVR